MRNRSEREVGEREDRGELGGMQERERRRRRVREEGVCV